MIKNVTIGVLIVLVLSLGIWQYLSHRDYQKLNNLYTTTKQELTATKLSNQLLQTEIDNQKTILEQHTKDATKTYNAYKELLNDIDSLNQVYNDWFNSDIPFDFSGVLNKTTDSDKVSGDNVHTTRKSTN